MTSHTTRRFRSGLAVFPVDVRKQTSAAYRLFLDNPWHPSLHFKQVHATEPVYSVRIGRNYRAVGVLEGQDILWFWIGTHREYEKLLKSL
jgi:hypothetical protein